MSTVATTLPGDLSTRTREVEEQHHQYQQQQQYQQQEEKHEDRLYSNHIIFGD